MTVHSCFVIDGNDDRLDLITDQGCAVDKYLMNNIEYPTDLMAVKEVHVFKYADRPVLQFQCQVGTSHLNCPFLLFRSQFSSKTPTSHAVVLSARNRRVKETARPHPQPMRRRQVQHSHPPK
jgi:hypothetical protein